MHLNFKVNKYVLLTGAGFTKNFGGFLAKEMRGSIFNYLDENVYSNLRELLRNDFDYESVYYKVVERNEFNKNEKQALTEAVFFAYKNLDDKIKGYYFLGEKQPVSIAAVKKFIDRFDGIPAVTGRNDTKGFFFTLNTDFHRVFKRHFSYGVQIILRGLCSSHGTMISLFNFSIPNKIGVVARFLILTVNMLPS